MRQRFSNVYGKVKNFGNSLKNYAKINPVDTARTAVNVFTGRGLGMAASDAAKNVSKIYNQNERGRTDRAAAAIRTARGLRASTPTPQERVAKMSLPNRGRAQPSTLKPPSGGVNQSLPPLPPPIKPMSG